jgi:hypothetical protein
MEHFHLQWVPLQLTLDLRYRRLEICWRLLSILEASELDSFRVLVAGDESWFVLKSQEKQYDNKK